MNTSRNILRCLSVPKGYVLIGQVEIDMPQLKLDKEQLRISGNDFVKFCSDGRLIIRNGYFWNGPSGPTFATTNTLFPSLIHDALYQLIELDVISASENSRETIDKIFHELLLEHGMNPIRAKLWYWAVRTFGGSRITKYNEAEEIQITELKEEEDEY